MPRPIRFVLQDDEAYVGVESQLLSLIEAQLADPKPGRGEYLPGATNFCLFIRPESEVVMSHGLADKNYLWTQDPQGRRYLAGRKHVLLPGEWLRRRVLRSRYLDLDTDHVHVVGWPRLDLLVAQMPASASGSEGDGMPRVLWAPTHNLRKRGDTRRSTSSFPDFEKYLPTLERFTHVDVSVHPRNRTDRTPTGASLPAADIVVADFGTTVYEAWALGKPVIFPRWLLGDRINSFMPYSAEALIFAERIGYHPESFDEMIDIVRAGPVITAEVQAFIDDYLAPEHLGSSSARTAAVLTEIATRQQG